MNMQGIKCSSFNVFPTSVLVWMAWHSFSHISLICFVLFWIISVLLWPSFSSLDANSFKERTLECPRGLISFTKSLNFFSSTYRINRDTDIKFSASVKETERINSSVVCNTKVIHCSVNHVISPEDLESEGSICCLDHLTFQVTKKNHPQSDKQMLPRTKKLASLACQNT